MSLPVVSNHFTTIQAKVYIKNFEECIKIKVKKEFEDIKFNILQQIIENYYFQYNSLKITMLSENIYLDSLETKKFASASHEYLVVQAQQIEFDDISIKGSYGLDFYHCCKELFWNLVKKFNINDIFVKQVPINKSIPYYKILYNPSVKFNLNLFITSLIYLFNNSNKNLTKIEDSVSLSVTENNSVYENYFEQNEILINGISFCNQNSNFYRFLHPYIYYNSLSVKSNSNIYSFSLKPTEFQPSGTINFTKIPTISVVSVINPKFKDIISEYSLVFSTTNYNVLRFIGGYAGLAYTYNF